MRILLIHQYFLEKKDGGGSRFNEMVKIWSEKGHKITVLAGMIHYNTAKKDSKYNGKFIFKDKNFYKNVDVIRCYVSKNYNKSFAGRLWAYFSFVFSSIYAGTFKTSYKYDLILVTSPPLFVCVTGYFLSVFYRVPLVFEIRDLWPESAIDTGILKNKLLIRFSYWFESLILKKASLINVLTPSFKTKLINEKKVSKDKIILIPNGADFSILNYIYSDSSFNSNNFRKELGFENKFVITYVGAHGKANHLIQLIMAAEKLTETNIIFQLIGSGMEKESLKREAKKRNLNNIVFRDPVSKQDVFKYILSSDVGASVLKKVDTFKTIYSNKTFDYMSCKIPVLMLIDGLSRNLIENADCGIYAEPENVNDIVEKILNFSVLSKSRITEMGTNGFNFVVKNFDRKKLSLKYLKSLEKL